MKIKRIDHISIAVKDLDAARKLWEVVLGKAAPDEVYVDENEQIRVTRYRLGSVGFELMESTTADGPVARWIEKHGEGVMVVSFSVDNTREAITELEPGGYRFIPDAKGKQTRPFRDGEFAFLHPGMMNGVLLELIDSRPDESNEG